jgi:acyl-CoA synthetase (AMP-forming)/AMP-acid ligase II
MFVNRGDPREPRVHASAWIDARSATQSTNRLYDVIQRYENRDVRCSRSKRGSQHERAAETASDMAPTPTPDHRARPLNGRTGRALWRERVETTPDAPFLVEDGGVASFARTDEQMRRVAAGLAGLGVGNGTRVAVGMPNAAETFWVHAALRELAAVIVPLVPGLTFPELAFQLEDSDATVLIIADPLACELLPRVDDFAQLRTIVLAGTAPAAAGARATATLAELLASEPRAPVAEHEGAEDSPWAIFYTSGSTGRPKGVVLPAGAFVNGGWGYAERFGLRQRDNYVVATSMAHAVGGLTEPSGAIHMGSRLTILERFSPSRFWSQIAASDGTVTILFPAQLNLLLALQAGGPERGQTPLRLVISHVHLDAFRERFGVELGVCWGMTETGAGSTGSRPDYRGEHGEGYVGQPMDGVEVAILDADQRPLPAGSEGEICLRTRHQMLGYLGDEEATQATLAGGWVHSGDIGSLDGDDGLYFRGRIKNMIKRAGENISPEEIEAALEAHEDVSESLVLAIPDPLRTEEAAAVVVLHDGAELAAEELIAFLAERLAAWKLPRYIQLRTEALPRLANDKIDRTRLREDLDLERCWDREATRAARAPGT